MQAGWTDQSDMNNRTIVIVAAALFIGLWMGNSNQPAPTDRPVMRWIAGLAKNLLWLSVIVEPPPPQHHVQSEIGEDGYVKVDHGRGW